MDTDVLISAATLAIGLIMLTASLWYTLRKRAAYRRSIKATGNVKAMRATSSVFVDSGDDNLAFRQEENVFKGDSFAPVIEFITQQGEHVEITGAASKPPRYRVGDRVKLLYVPESPDRAVIDAFLDKWLLAIFLLTFSAVTTLTGGIMLLVLSR